ncbi:MAG: hypothetical protein ACLGHN_07250 [Bacteriovoracia bacterium]
MSFHSRGVTYINHFNSQFAGEVGLVSVGLGKDFRRYSIGGMYGVVPTEVSGGVLIETITLRQTYDFFHWQRLAAYGGLNIFHVLGIQYRTEDYGEVPDRYYPVGSIRGLLNLGLATTFNKRESRIIYVEAGLNDIAITNLINNAEVINVADEFSLALGFKQKF